MHNIFKLQNSKDKKKKSWKKPKLDILCREKQRITFAFSSEKMQTRRAWGEIFKMITVKQILEFFNRWNYLPKVRALQGLRLTITEGICCQYIFLVRNLKYFFREYQNNIDQKFRSICEKEEHWRSNEEHWRSN